MRDCVIVYGYPANDDGTISPILKSRMDKAIELYHQNKVRYLIVSGGAIHNSVVEAQVMKKYAIANGVMAERIHDENVAKSTYHNVLYSKHIMEVYHYKTCYIVTNSWHMPRAKYYAWKFKLDYEAAPCANPEGIDDHKAFRLKLDTYFHMVCNFLKGYH